MHYITALKNSSNRENRLLIYILIFYSGHRIPQHLDPVTRKRGTQGLVRDGPVTHTIAPSHSGDVPIHRTVVSPNSATIHRIVSIKKSGEQDSSLHLIDADGGLIAQTNLLEGNIVQVYYGLLLLRAQLLLKIYVIIRTLRNINYFCS